MDDGKLMVGGKPMEKEDVLKALKGHGAKQDRRELAESLAKTPEGLALLQDIAREVMEKHRFVDFTGRKGKLGGKPYVIGTNGCCGIHDSDGDVAVVVTISGRVYLRFSQGDEKVVVPREVIDALCLLPVMGHYGASGMFDENKPEYFEAIKEHPSCQLAIDDGGDERDHPAYATLVATDLDRLTGSAGQGAASG